jgi:hypothetical protein
MYKNKHYIKMEIKGKFVRLSWFYGNERPELIGVVAKVVNNPENGWVRVLYNCKQYAWQSESLYIVSIVPEWYNRAQQLEQFYEKQYMY